MGKAPAGTGALIGQRIGKYEVLALLALGGTAEIYLARIGGAAGFEKFVVIKCLHEHLADDDEFVSMFLDEARLAAQLDHSNIVQTFELGQHEGRYFMALEFLGGLSLAMMVRRVVDRTPTGRLPVPMALTVIQQACVGLHYAHERTNGGTPLNVVHRDISPQNLVVTFEGQVKLVDFGIARADQRETRTRAGTIKGKFAYMSPEQCVSNAVDRRTDVFALGVVLYELLTGKRLFKRPNQYDTYQAVIECAVPPPSTQVPELELGLDALVMKALAKDRELRYPTAEAFGDAILRYLHQRGLIAGPSELGRFMEAAYAAELAEHGGRMRELLEGRRATDEASGDWDEEIDGEVVEPSRVGAVMDDRPPAEDDRARSDVTGEIETGDIEAGEIDLGARAATPPPDEEGAEATRIELNPLLDRGRAASPAVAPRPEVAAVPTVIVPGELRAEPSGPMPLPAPPTTQPGASVAKPTVMGSRAALRSSTVPPVGAAPPPARASSKFGPDGPGLATALASLDEPSAVPTAPPEAAHRPPPRASAPPPTPLAGSSPGTLPSAEASRVASVAPARAAPRASAPPAVTVISSDLAPGAPPPAVPATPRAPASPTAPPGAPTSIQDTGAAVAAAHQLGGAAAPPTSAPGVDAAAPRSTLGSPAPAAAPYRVDSAGVATPNGADGALATGYLGPAAGHARFDLGPVSGPPIRRLPPWALAALFVIGLGLAMGLTIAVARALA